MKVKVMLNVDALLMQVKVGILRVIGEAVMDDNPQFSRSSSSK